MTQTTASQFFQGATAPLRGLRVVAKTPSLWALAVLPVALSIVFLVAAVFGALVSAGPITRWLLPELGPGLLFALARGLVVGLLGLLYGGLAYMSATLLSIPINDAMSERVESLVGSLPPPITFREALPRSIRHSVAGVGLWVVIELGLLPLQLLPGIGSVLGGFLGFLVTAWFLAHQLMDGPMSRRSLSFKDKMVFLREHLPWTLGLGCLGALVMLIPLANLIALPVLIAGGAVLWSELEQDRREAL